MTVTEISAGWTRPDPACGVFETLAVRDGRVQALDRHLDRLAGAVAELYGHQLPPGLEARARGIAGQLVGAHRLRVRAHPEAGELMVRIESEPFASAEPQPTIILTPVLVPGGLGAYKWCDRRLIDDRSSGGGTPLIVDVSDEVLEAAWANVWLVEGDRIITPPADGRLLPGITRLLLLERTPELGLTASTEPITLTRAREADAIFLTSSLRYAVSAAIDGTPSAHNECPSVPLLSAALSEACWDV
ncbi:MAG: aminotransferase class IV [Solirubrobacterales bacterium]|nr:aminotransferase class IV [Solirubrobacterales bacterium]MBV9917406.1 aminotransferase class IV [Solirubrobacterales bacterium]